MQYMISRDLEGLVQQEVMKIEKNWSNEWKKSHLFQLEQNPQQIKILRFFEIFEFDPCNSKHTVQ